jgi:hypothetical protein
VAFDGAESRSHFASRRLNSVCRLNVILPKTQKVTEFPQPIPKLNAVNVDDLL